MPLLLLCLPLAVTQAQEQRYFYDETNQLTKSIDDTGVVIEYIYDESGNRLKTRRTVINGLAIFNLSPSRVAPGDTLAIDGQQFSSVASQNSVTINTVPATVTSASATQLIVTVPNSATTGLLAVDVNGVSVNGGLVFVLHLPVISSVSPGQLVSDPLNDRLVPLTVGGNALTASTFQLTPTFVPPLISLTSATIDVTGASASLLTATIVPASLIPVMCWMAPEIPKAIYRSGEMILPV